MLVRPILVLLLVLLLPASDALAGLPDGPQTAPDALGPWAVGQRNGLVSDPARGDRPLPLRIWYPVDPGDEGDVLAFYELMDPLGITSEVATEDAPVSRQRGRPLIVFSHGSGGFNIQSIQLCETLASHGFIVAAPNHTGNTVEDFQNGTDVPFLESAFDRPLDISFVIDHMLERSGRSDGPFEGRVRPHGVGVAGHSFGGFTALAMASGWQTIPPDPRVSAIMPIAPASGLLSDDELRGIHLPVMFLSATLDTITPLDPSTTRPWSLIRFPFVYRADIVGAGHNHFANICDIADVLIAVGLGPPTWPFIGADALIEPYFDTCVPPAFPLDEAQRLQDLYAVSFFRRHLRQESSYAGFLTERYAERNEPDVIFFAALTRCGLGFELSFVLLPVIALRRARKRRTALAAFGES